MQNKAQVQVQSQVAAPKGRELAPVAPAPATPGALTTPPQNGPLTGGPPSAPQATPGTCQIPGGTYQQLKAQQDELLNQRQILANRRSAIGGEYERSTGANKAGLGSRISILDGSIVQMETQIACLAQGMSIKAPVDPGQIGRHWRDGQVAGLAFTIFFVTVMTSNAIWRRIGPRRWAHLAPHGANLPASNERLERIEQAVDTIAVEIERVSENQRFMTRLMTETQLAGTIAQVRNSAEAAKSEVG